MDVHGPIFLSDIPSPFGLAAPAKWWQDALAAYDPDLRIFPSQTKPLYRVMRVARLSGGMNYERMKAVVPMLGGDTKIALERGLVPVMTFGPDVFNRSPAIIVGHLERRDTWKYGRGGEGGGKAADALDAMEAAEEEREKIQARNERRERRKAFAIAYRYRTGGRVSLVRPRRHDAGAASPATPAASAASVTPQE